MKRIAIIELETHIEVLQNWNLILKESIVFEVDFYLHSKIKKNINFINDENVFYYDDNQDLKYFLESIPNYDLVIINTFHRHFEMFEKIFEYKNTLTIIHNANFSILGHSLTFSNLWIERNRILYFLKLYLKERITKHKSIISKSNYLGVLNDRIKVEIENSKLFANNKIIKIPLVFNKQICFPKTKNINIIIPGTVSQKRKNYAMIFEIIKNLKPNVDIDFYFLGQPENKKMAKKLKKISELKLNKLKINYYSEHIPAGIFEEIIKSAHLILCPIKIKTSFYGVSEYYGKTKISGSEFDCIKNGKIGIFPESYPKFGWKNFYYKDQFDLKDLIENLTLDKLEQEYSELYKIAECYQIEEKKVELETKLLELL